MTNHDSVPNLVNTRVVLLLGKNDTTEWFHLSHYTFNNSFVFVYISEKEDLSPYKRAKHPHQGLSAIPLTSGLF